LEFLPLKNRSSLIQSFLTKPFCAQIVCSLLIALVSLGLSSCHSASYYYYKFPTFTFADRPVPPSKLANRVMVGLTANGSTGALEMLDALRDIRSTIQNPNTTFTISGFSEPYPSMIFNFPEEVHAYVYSPTGSGVLQIVNYSTEASAGTGGSFPGLATSLAIPASANHIYAAQQSIGQLGIIDNTTGRTYGLNLPNVTQVAVNQGDTVVLAMVRNSNTLYRIFKLNQNQYPTSPAAISATGSIDCQPFNVPVYCVVPVPGNLPGATATANDYDRPVSAYFSLDGATAYVLNCGAECGGTTSSVSMLQQGLLEVTAIPTTATQPTPVTAKVLIPGGATVALAGNSLATSTVPSKPTLYVAGQRLQTDSDNVQRFAGFLTTIDLTANIASAPISISDGNHSKMLFGDDNTLWIGSQYCATGERIHLGQNYNCLTRFDMSALTASIVPALVPASAGAAPTVVPYPNGNNDMQYYGSLTGLCWVQGLHKVYTAYGGQVHAFNTADGSEINNQNITVQGTALDVAYMDALTDAAD
jgi:hypothetical protein